MYLGHFTNFKSHPQLLLLSGLPAEFGVVQQALGALSPDTPLAINDLEGIQSVSGTALRVRQSARNGITRLSATDFEWETTPDALDESLELIAPLAASRDAGHQYFEFHPADDAVIMMSVGEYDDGWWQRQVIQLHRCVSTGASSPFDSDQRRGTRTQKRS